MTEGDVALTTLPQDDIVWRENVERALGLDAGGNRWALGSEKGLTIVGCKTREVTMLGQVHNTPCHNAL